MTWVGLGFGLGLALTLPLTLTRARGKGGADHGRAEGEKGEIQARYRRDSRGGMAATTGARRASSATDLAYSWLAMGEI